MSSRLQTPAWRSSAAGAALVLPLLFLTGCAPAGTSAEAGGEGSRAVRLIVGVSPGGGQDLYARLIAAHLGRHLPEHPSIVVENMPGAGGLLAADYLARRAAPDGTALGLLGIQAVLAQLLNEAPRFDIRDLPVVGSPADDSAVCLFSRASGFTLDAWRQGRVPRLGMTNRGSTTASYAFLVSAALELPVHPVIGYAGTSDIKAAMAGGEIDGLCMSQSSLVALFQPLDGYTPAVQVGAGAEQLAGVRQATDLVTSDRGRRLLGVAATVGRLARFFALPPHTPPARVAEIRNAFEDTMKDPAFLSAAARAGLEIDVQPADSLETLMRDLLGLPTDIRRDVIAALEGTP